MSKTLPTNAIALLEENNRFPRAKKYIAAFFILFTTFAIPVTITQFSEMNNVSSNAYNAANKNLSSFQNVSTTSSSANILSSLPSYWWIFLLVGVLLGLWIYLIVLFVRVKNAPY